MLGKTQYLYPINDTVTEILTDSAHSPSSRIKSLDILRGAAIIGVITVHIMFGMGRGVDGDVAAGFNVAELVYAGLPMFMVITGYFYRSGRRYIDNVKHRVVPVILVLIISTVFLTSIMYGYMWVLGYDLSNYDLFNDIMTIIIGKECFNTIGVDGFTAGAVLAPYDISAGYYYLQILTVGLLIFYAIADHVLDDWRKTVTAIFALLSMTALYLELVNIQLPFSAQLGPVVASFLLLGALMGRYNVANFIENGYHERKYWLIFGAFIIAAVASVILFPSGMNLYNSKFGANGALSVFTFLFLSITCGAVLWYITALLIKVPVVSAIFTYAGLNSIILFTQHMFVAKLITAPFYTLGTKYWVTVDSIGMRFVILMVTLGLLFGMCHFLHRLRNDVPDETADDDTTYASR